MNDITYVGMDVHKATISVAVAAGERGGEVRHLGVFANRLEINDKLITRLAQDGRRLSSSTRQVPAVTGCTGSWWRAGMAARWSPPR